MTDVCVCVCLSVCLLFFLLESELPCKLVLDKRIWFSDEAESDKCCKGQHVGSRVFLDIGSHTRICVIAIFIIKFSRVATCTIWISAFCTCSIATEKRSNGIVSAL